MVKLALVDEPGSDEVEKLVAAPGVVLVTCRITALEVRATLAAAQRAGRLDDELAAQRLEALWARLALVEIDAGLCAAAGDAAETHGLRSLDAVHLAAVITVRDRSAESLALVSWDERLRRAARDEGLEALPQHT